MPVAPRIPRKELQAALEKRVASRDRGIFTGILAKGLSIAPRQKDWKKLREDPEKYGRTIATFAKLNGYAERTESVNVSMDVNALAETLVNRYGAEKARTMLTMHGLPASLIPIPDEPIDSSVIVDPDVTGKA